MTDAQLRDILRPHVRRILATGAAGDRPRTPAAGAGDDDLAGFAPSDLDRFSDYFAGGGWPDSVRRAFGVDAKTFAEKTGLKLRNGVWVEG